MLRYLLLTLCFCLFACDEAPEPAPDLGAAADWVDDAVIYEVFVPDASPEGTFRGLIPRLPALKSLGVNTLWLMPIHPIGVENRKGVLGSPYAIRDYYGVNPEYGTEEDLRALVDAVHAEGMHLIIDYVANHTAWDHPWVEEHPDWYTDGSDGGITVPLDPNGNPTDWTDVADLDYGNAELQAEMIRVLRYWVEEFGIDGYRCDVASWVPTDFWEEAIAAVRQVKPVLMLAESEDPALHRAGFDLTYAWPFYQKLKAVWGGEPVAELVSLVRETEAELPESGRRLRFTTNHDETAWDATPPQLFGGQAGARAAFVLAASLPGVPLVYNGQETGQDEPVPFFDRTPYDWQARPEVQRFFTEFLGLYAQSPALRHGDLTFLSPDHEDVLFIAREAEGEHLVVAVNTRDYAVDVAWPEDYRGATLTHVFTDETGSAGDMLNLPPYGVFVLRR